MDRVQDNSDCNSSLVGRIGCVNTSFCFASFLSRSKCETAHAELRGIPMEPAWVDMLHKSNKGESDTNSYLKSVVTGSCDALLLNFRTRVPFPDQLEITRNASDAVVPMLKQLQGTIRYYSSCRWIRCLCSCLCMRRCSCSVVVIGDLLTAVVVRGRRERNHCSSNGQFTGCVSMSNGYHHRHQCFHIFLA